MRAQEPSASLPRPEDVLRAYEVASAWVRAGTAPASMSAADPEQATGACVTLRLAGRVIGRASSLEADRSNLWRSTREALIEAAPALKSAGSGAPGLGTHVTIDLQFAGRQTPLLGEDFETATADVAPGIDGVAARIGDKLEAIFPGTMIATGSTPAEALRVCAARLSLPPVELGELRRKHGIAVYRFSATQLAQCGADQAPVFLTRAGRIVGLQEVTGQGLRRAAAAIASHLYTHEWPGAEPCGMTGDYDPLTDRYQPLIAPPMAQSAVALAMARYAAVPGLAPAERDRALRFGARVIESLARVDPEEADPAASTADAAMVLAAILELERAGGPGVLSVPRPFRDSIESSVSRSIGTDGQWASQCPPQVRSIVAMALALTSLESPENRGHVEVAVRSLFRDTDRSRLAGEMPWLGWAELALARGAGASVPSAAVLRDLRDTCWLHQVDATQTDSSSPDLAGGILFSRGRTVLPTWHTLRPIAFLATSLGDPRLTESAELPHHLAALKRSLRFLLQLQADRTAAHMYRDPDRSLGGVRAAPWDQKQPLEASALGLLTISETLKSLAARAASPSPASEPDAR